jgi:hypothetical protein
VLVKERPGERCRRLSQQETREATQVLATRRGPEVVEPAHRPSTPPRATPQALRENSAQPTPLLLGASPGPLAPEVEVRSLALYEALSEGRRRAMMSRQDARVCQALQRLKRPSLLTQLDGVRAQAAQKQLPSLDFLNLLLAEELRLRQEKNVECKIQMARFPCIKTVDDFDAPAQPSGNERQVKELATLRVLERGANRLLLGPPGVGTTPLAIALGLQAILGGYSVIFVIHTDLMATVTKAF